MTIPGGVVGLPRAVPYIQYTYMYNIHIYRERLGDRAGLQQRLLLRLPLPAQMPPHLPGRLHSLQLGTAGYSSTRPI